MALHLHSSWTGVKKSNLGEAMKILSAISILLFTLQAVASSYYCNGVTKQSGSSWYYPNGVTAQSGSSVYYENGVTFKSGSSLYFKNGVTFVSGSSMYYSNSVTLKSGSSYYHSNGNTLKSGSSCYYENGSSMGSCPATIRILAGLDYNDLEVTMNLNSDVRIGMNYRFVYGGKPGFVTLAEDGSIIDIQYECNSSSDSAVNALLKNYQSMTSDQKLKVRTNICM